MARKFEIHLDAGLCIGSGLCLGIAPEHFEAGPDHRTVLRASVAEANDALNDAAACCPVEAIRIVEQ
jgi:ferredoxin